MRSLDAAELSAILAGTVVAREFVWITAKTRDTADEVTIGLWSDAGDYTCNVVDGLTGSTVSRSFKGAGLISVGDVRLISDLSVRTVDVELAAIDDQAEAALRTYDCRGAPIQIYRGFFDPNTNALVAAAKPRFVGFIDEAPIVTAEEGGVSKATLSCASHTRELTRKNSDVRSHESQLRRAAGDTLFKDTNVVADWDISWGENRTTHRTSGLVAGTGFVRAGEAAQ